MKTKKCAKCGEIKELGEFYKRNDNGKYRSECKICQNLKAIAYALANKGRVSGGGEKKCSKCNKVKSLDKFTTDRRKRSGIGSWCKICKNTARKVHYLKNRKRDCHKVRDCKRLARYNITSKQYAQMVAGQNGVCGICGNPETAIIKNTLRQLSVDHCHETDQIRGLLCTKCNRALGMFEDSIDILASAISYLRNANLSIRRIG